jgi:hypothetical protein
VFATEGERMPQGLTRSASVFSCYYACFVLFVASFLPVWEVPDVIWFDGRRLVLPDKELGTLWVTLIGAMNSLRWGIPLRRFMAEQQSNFGGFLAVGLIGLAVGRGVYSLEKRRRREEEKQLAEVK